MSDGMLILQSLVNALFLWSILCWLVAMFSGLTEEKPRWKSVLVILFAPVVMPWRIFRN
jgi:hypothetical protein